MAKKARKPRKAQEARGGGTRRAPRAKRSGIEPGASVTAALGKAIRLRRKQLGLTQEALAMYAGCGLAFLYELESGKPTVRLDKVLAALRVLGMTLRLEPGREPLTVEAPDA